VVDEAIEVRPLGGLAAKSEHAHAAVVLMHVGRSSPQRADEVEGGGHWRIIGAARGGRRRKAAYNRPMKPTLHYAELGAALERLGGVEEPSEYHGTLCGALCVQAPAAIDPLSLFDAEAADLRSDRPAEELLKRLREETHELLVSSDMGFAPLLPADDLPLAARVQALALWCQGFLYGLSSRERLDFKGCSEEAREIMRDFSQFTQA